VTAMRAVLVPIGEEIYAVATERVREVVTSLQITPVPTAPPWVLGLINVRGEVVPVLDTGALLGIGATPSPCYAVVVISSSGLAGLLATSMPSVATLGEELGPSDLPATGGFHQVTGGMAVTLDIDALIIRAQGSPAGATVGRL
jgi:purine-binding chemotaxis protein CheW